MKFAFTTYSNSLKLFFVFVMSLFITSGNVFADEDLYHKLSRITKSQQDVHQIKKLNQAGRQIDWGKAKEIECHGHLRVLKTAIIKGTDDETKLYFVRNITGEMYLLSVPNENEIIDQDLKSAYSNLEKMLEYKMNFKLLVAQKTVNGEAYNYTRFKDAPQQLALDKIFKTSIVLMLFFVMLGMGLTLTINDFKIVFQKPKGILTGAILQWAVMPFVAAALGKMLGFFEAFPYIYVGIVLITVSPGGVTSNLMTYYAKGDLALSISLTSFSTVLSLFFTPFLLTLLCANVPEVTIPVKLVVQTIIILVIIPLAIGMFIRNRWPVFAEKSTGFFSILGVIALLFLIIAGILGNLEVFTDTERYGVKFYTTVFLLTMLGMFIGAVVPKMVGVNNYQTRAISLETGLRNASLAMALSILIQDYMGDFYASMFFTSAMFGILMYPAGFIAIEFQKKFLPVEPQPPIPVKVEEGEY
ncbi:MAG: bile acid:sodium symporter family protein [Spirochaetes bacterium]|nr:bile acid:sodium symporter family protein [Spirochaetota bacterium]